MDTGQNSLFEYMYRDASNWKYYGEVVVAGRLKLSDLEPYLVDDEFFVLEDVGLPALRPAITNEDDHIYHMIVAIEPCTRQVAENDAEALRQAFKHNRATNELWWPLNQLGYGPKLSQEENLALIARLKF